MKTHTYMQQSQKIKVIYNEDLFIKLPHILKVPKCEIGYSIGMSKMWYTHAANRQDVMLKYIVKLCNKWHLSINDFIVNPLTYTDPISYIQEPFKPLEFYPSQLRLLWQDRSSPIVLRKDLQQEGGWDRLTMRGFMNDENSCITIRDWVFMVNQYNLDPMMIFKKKERVTRKELIDKEETIRMLREQLAAANETVKKLTGKQ